MNIDNSKSAFIEKFMIMSIASKMGTIPNNQTIKEKLAAKIFNIADKILSLISSSYRKGKVEMSHKIMVKIASNSLPEELGKRVLFRNPKEQLADKPPVLEQANINTTDSSANVKVTEKTPILNLKTPNVEKKDKAKPLVQSIPFPKTETFLAPFSASETPDQQNQGDAQEGKTKEKPITQPIPKPSTEKISVPKPKFTILQEFIVETEKQAKEQLVDLPVGSCKIWPKDPNTFYCLQKMPRGFFNQIIINNTEEKKVIQFIKNLNSRSKQIATLETKGFIIKEWQDWNNFQKQNLKHQNYKIFIENGGLYITDKDSEVALDIDTKEDLFKKIENHFSEDGQFEAAWQGLLVKNEKEAKEQLRDNFNGSYKFFKNGDGFKFIQKISNDYFYEAVIPNKNDLRKKIDEFLSFENQWIIYQQAQLVEENEEKAKNKLKANNVPVGSYAFWKAKDKIYFTYKLPDEQILSFAFKTSKDNDVFSSIQNFNRNSFQQQLYVLEKLERYFTYTADETNFYYHPDNQLNVKFEKLAVGDYLVWKDANDLYNDSFLASVNFCQKMPGNQINYTKIYEDENLFQKMNEMVSRRGQWKALQMHGFVTHNELEAEEQLKNEAVGSYKVWKKAHQRISEEQAKKILTEDESVGEVECLLKLNDGKFIKITIKETEDLFSNINELMFKNKPKVQKASKFNSKENALEKLNNAKKEFLAIHNKILVFTGLPKERQLSQDSFKDVKFSALPRLYRQLSVLIHPDKNKKEGAIEEFKVLNAKWATIQEIVEVATGKDFSTDLLSDIDNGVV